MCCCPLVYVGAYGVVVSATDQQTNREVAIKRIATVFDSIGEATRILRELKFLRLLRSHENVISILDVLLPSDTERFRDVCVVFELMPTDLQCVLRSPLQVTLSPDHQRFIMYQLLAGLAFLHASNVLHRDLKPANILINDACEVRICDFGLARAAFATTPGSDGRDPTETVFWTDYVATRWYRAPELLLSAYTSYSTAIDLWSAGCIFAEVVSGGVPLFPGLNNRDMLSRQVALLGTPARSAMETVRDTAAKRYLLSLPASAGGGPNALAAALPSADPNAVRIIRRLLAFDPRARASAAELLGDPWFAEYRAEDVGRVAYMPPGSPLQRAEFEFERYKLDAEQMRWLFLKEMAVYHPAQAHVILRSLPQTVDEEEAAPEAPSAAGGGAAAAAAAPPAEPSLEYAVPSEAARFRATMLAVQSGAEPPPGWTSLPTQTMHGMVGGAVDPLLDNHNRAARARGQAAAAKAVAEAAAAGAPTATATATAATAAATTPTNPSAAAAGAPPSNAGVLAHGTVNDGGGGAPGMDGAGAPIDSLSPIPSYMDDGDGGGDGGGDVGGVGGSGGRGLGGGSNAVGCGNGGGGMGGGGGSGGAEDMALTSPLMVVPPPVWPAPGPSSERADGGGGGACDDMARG
ncbi:hypothetical protein I4F81_009695 [Pyropia yezoensis]|uniref:Uncharacterized protein n=1 Tax=Pyropia yezoensis TaxID=2788 RepID=A0ACC3CAT9_PYRYE|nr:hypothetical protein I4F81_009695 [Neopyropia yezoensis]